MIQNNTINSPLNIDRYFSNALLQTVPQVDEIPLANNIAFSIENTPIVDNIDEKNCKVNESLFKLCLTDDLLTRLDETSPAKVLKNKKNNEQISNLTLIGCIEEEASENEYETGNKLKNDFIDEYNNLAADSLIDCDKKLRSFSCYSNSNTICSKFSEDNSDKKKELLDNNIINNIYPNNMFNSTCNQQNFISKNYNPNARLNHMEILSNFQKNMLAACQAKTAFTNLNSNVNLSKSDEKLKIKRAGWTCSSCTNFNYESRKNCNRCLKPMKDNSVLSASTKTSENNSPNSSFEKSETKIRANSDLIDKKQKKFAEREGDWTCTKCNNLNFAFRDTCNRCNVNKLQTEKLVEQNMKNMMMIIQYNQMMQMQMRNNLNIMKNANAKIPAMPMNMPIIPFNPLIFKAMQQKEQKN